GRGRRSLGIITSPPVPDGEAPAWCGSRARAARDPNVVKTLGDRSVAIALRGSLAAQLPVTGGRPEGVGDDSVAGVARFGVLLGRAAVERQPAERVGLVAGAVEGREGVRQQRTVRGGRAGDGRVQ